MRKSSLLRSLARLCVAASLTATAACATSQAQQQQDQQQAMLAMALQPPALPPPVDTVGQQQAALAASAHDTFPAARIDGKPILETSVAAHQEASGLTHAEAVSDLIDVTLLREAATKRGIVVPAGPLTPEAREETERKVASAMALELPPETTSLVVDHAWIKNASTTAGRAAQRKAIDQLHDAAVAGEAIPAAFPKLTGVKAADWHIGDHEEYPVDVVPAAARELIAGSVSSVMPGDGGLHLFKIHERKRNLPAASVVHAAVRDQLLEGRIIEVIELAH